MASASRGRFRFGDFELDVGACELRRDGKKVRLEGHPKDLLILLVERRPQLVTRQEIVDLLWGGDTFVEADTGINTVVHKLRQALGDSAASPAFVERVPGKGYRFVAEVAAVGDPPETAAAAAGADPHVVTEGNPPKPPRPGSPLLVGLTTAGLLVAASGLAWLLTQGPEQQASSGELVRLTGLTGFETDPSFSVDGRELAFAWSGEGEDNYDIYVQTIGSADVRRLTTDHGADRYPAWSPDGRLIAYTRAYEAGRAQQLRVMTSVGGSDRQLAEFPAWSRVSWTPDGRFIAVGRAVLPGDAAGENGIYLVPVAGGSPRAMTRPTAGSDDSPVFSPDGRRLAYASCRETVYRYDCHVMLARVDASLAVTGSPRLLTRQAVRRVLGITWSRDGRWISYSAGYPTGRVRLWRAPSDGSRAPTRIEEAGFGAQQPATSPAGDLAFSQVTADTDISRFDARGPTRRVAPAPGLDAQPQISNDGTRFAYCSERGGDIEVWIAAMDGSGVRQLTRGPGLEQCSPSWSPEDRYIAFDSVGADGAWHIWIVGVDGEGLRQVTNEEGDQTVPRWSRDGQWLYFSWDDGNGRNIWRVHRSTGRRQRVTTAGSGWAAMESPDGAGILYPASVADSPLMWQSLDGRTREEVPCVIGGAAVALGPLGVYYLPCPESGRYERDQPLRAYDPSTRRDFLLGRLEGYHAFDDLYRPTFRALAVSPDGKTVLYNRRVAVQADLMMIRGLR